VNEREKLVTDTLQKAGLGMFVGAFFQVEHPAVILLFSTIAMICFVIAYGLTPNE
jgi:hypothetical protein